MVPFGRAIIGPYFSPTNCEQKGLHAAFCLNSEISHHIVTDTETLSGDTFRCVRPTNRQEPRLFTEELFPVSHKNSAAAALN